MVPVSLGLFAWTSKDLNTDINLATMGISGTLCVVHIIFGLSVFAYATGDRSDLTTVFCIAHLAFGALIVLILRATTPIIAKQIERNDTGSEYNRIAREITTWSSSVDDKQLRDALTALAEELRYYPRHTYLDGPLPDRVEELVDDFATYIRAKDWVRANCELQTLKVALERSSKKIISRYTKA